MVTPWMTRPLFRQSVWTWKPWTVPAWLTAGGTPTRIANSASACAVGRSKMAKVAVPGQKAFCVVAVMAVLTYVTLCILAWRMGFRYSYTQPERTYFQPGTTGLFDNGSSQTLDADFAFPLTPGWGMTWNTSYSLTDREFGSHRLNFRRDLHRWEANFSFYQTPTGNTAFEFFVNLIDNPDIKFDHRETNLGIDR